MGLSGAYDFSDRTAEDYGNHQSPLPMFIDDVTNYTNKVDLATQKSYSPVALVTTPSESVPFKPILAINSRYDPMPYHQLADLQCAFETAGVDPALYKFETVPDASDHAFAMWNDYDNGYPSAQLVKTRVISFLDAYLK